MRSVSQHSTDHARCLIGWDWADRLTKVTSNGVVVLENFYDAGSHRVGKADLIGGATVSYVYLFDRWDIVGISSAGSGLYETYTRGVALAGDIGGLVGIARHPFNTRYYVHNNHRGDIIHVRANALTLSTHRYTAFGEIIGTTSSVSRFRFSSKEYERSCGLYHYGYRFYAPQWQRWVSADLIREVGGLNLYRFCYNSAVRRIDPLGLDSCSTDLTSCLDAAKRDRDWNCSELGKAHKNQKDAARVATDYWSEMCSSLGSPTSPAVIGCQQAVEKWVGIYAGAVDAAYWPLLAGILAEYSGEVAVCYTSYVYCKANKIGIF